MIFFIQKGLCEFTEDSLIVFQIPLPGPGNWQPVAGTRATIKNGAAYATPLAV
jgi:hypothetical protein